LQKGVTPTTSGVNSRRNRPDASRQQYYERRRRGSLIENQCGRTEAKDYLHPRVVSNPGERGV